MLHGCDSDCNAVAVLRVPFERIRCERLHRLLHAEAHLLLLRHHGADHTLQQLQVLPEEEARRTTQHPHKFGKMCRRVASPFKSASSHRFHSMCTSAADLTGAHLSNLLHPWLHAERLLLLRAHHRHLTSTAVEPNMLHGSCILHLRAVRAQHAAVGSASRRLMRASRTCIPGCCICIGIPRGIGANMFGGGKAAASLNTRTSAGLQTPCPSVA